MRSRVRLSLVALLVGAITAVLAPAAAQASFGIEKFVAVNCSAEHSKCAEETVVGPDPFGPYSVPKEPNLEETEKQGYTQAGGHVPYGVTDFKVTTVGSLLEDNQVPTGIVTHIRTDVAPGLATSPNATAQCSMKAFDASAKEEEAIPGTGFYPAPECNSEEGEPTKDTVIGVNKVTVYAGEAAGDVPLEGNVYNLVQPEGLASDFGVALKIPIPISAGGLAKGFKEAEAKSEPVPSLPVQKFLEEQQYYAHTLIEGNVEWGKEAKGTNAGDYHDYFEINVSPKLPLISSRLTFFGRSGEGYFVTNATSCPGHNTTTLHMTSAEGTVTQPYTALVGLSGCNLVPFEPTFAITPATTAVDQPDGITTELGVPQHLGAEEENSSQLKEAVIKLPEGMTLNPSAAAGLTACTPAEARIHSSTPGVGCASSSSLGTISLEVPTLPPGSLTGNMYLGGPEGGGPITKPPYIVYLDAESTKYGVSVRVEGEVEPNEATGQLTTRFKANPEQPFTKVTLNFKPGGLAPIANPLTCGTATTTTVLSPFTGLAAREPSSSFVVDSNGEKGACASPLPFAPSQEAFNQYGNAGGHTVFKFKLTRPEGQQYMSRVQTKLPAGLVGAIPTVPLCTTASTGSCPAESLLGTATVTAGSGLHPYPFSGNVYLTGPYEGAPYGMFISVPEIAGPFNLGNVITRATINVEPKTGRVIVGSTLPAIAPGGIPTRLRSVSVEINRPGFLSNPTNCGALATESTVTGSSGTNAALSTPFGVANCSALKFTPSFKAATGGKPSKALGASLETTINQPAGQANIKSVQVQLPIQLPSRQSTLEKACSAVTFEANPKNCSPESIVGSARANTPVLPGKLTGLAYLVGHAGAAFPDLDLVLEANGVKVILVGNTDIKKGITKTTFATAPDVPVSSITVNLPMGPHSALSAYGSLCGKPLVMPTTITGQNGVVVKQNTIIKPVGCGVQIVGHKVVGNTAYITVKTPAAGRVSGSGASVATGYRHLSRAEKAATIKVNLSRRGRLRGRPFRTRIRIGFVPKNRRTPSSVAYVTVTFR
jgi:hypothetical protein